MCQREGRRTRKFIKIIMGSCERLSTGVLIVHLLLGISCSLTFSVRVTVGVWGSRVVQTASASYTHVPHADWTMTGLFIVSNPVCGVHWQNLKAQSWREGCLIWGSQGLTSAFYKWHILLVSSGQISWSFESKDKATSLFGTFFSNPHLWIKTAEMNFFHWFETKTIAIKIRWGALSSLESSD